MSRSGGSVTPSRYTSRVGETWMPIFSSPRPTENPSSSAWTTNAAMPFDPLAGSPWAKIVYRSDTPALVMNRLVPFNRKPPSVGSYRVRMAPASEPEPGSVSAYDIRCSPRAMPPKSPRFCSSEPASMIGIAPSRATSGISETPADARAISSIITAKDSDDSPAPPYASGYPTAISSWSTSRRWKSWGNSSVSSISAARGATPSSHTARTAFRQAGLLEGVLQGDRRDGVEVRVPIRAHAVGHHLRQRLQAEGGGALGANHHQGGAPIGDLRGVARRDRAGLPERRPQGRQGLLGGLGADPLVAVDHRDLALPAGDLDGHDLLGHAPLVPRGRGAPVAPGGPGVLLLAADPQLDVDFVRRFAHVLVGERGPQPVVDHRVDQLGVAQADAPPGRGQEVRGSGHRLHPPGHHHLDLSGADQLVGQGHGVQPRQADLVDRDRRDLPRDTGPDGGLPGGDLAGPGLDHLAHDHVVDLVSLQPRPGEGLPDRRPAEVDGLDVAEPAAEPTDRRPSAAHDHRTRHVVISLFGSLSLYVRGVRSPRRGAPGTLSRAEARRRAWTCWTESTT